MTTPLLVKVDDPEAHCSENRSGAIVDAKFDKHVLEVRLGGRLADLERRRDLFRLESFREKLDHLLFARRQRRFLRLSPGDCVWGGSAAAAADHSDCLD